MSVGTALSLNRRCIQVHTTENSVRRKYSKLWNLSQLISVQKTVEETLIISNPESYI